MYVAKFWFLISVAKNARQTNKHLKSASMDEAAAADPLSAGLVSTLLYRYRLMTTVLCLFNTFMDSVIHSWFHSFIHLLHEKKNHDHLYWILTCVPRKDERNLFPPPSPPLLLRRRCLRIPMENASTVLMWTESPAVAKFYRRKVRLANL
jgi:hypothetical protein